VISRALRCEVISANNGAHGIIAKRLELLNAVPERQAATNGPAVNLGGDGLGRAGQDGERVDAIVIADRTGGVGAADFGIGWSFSFLVIG
jgi:hypothetical protein